MIVYVGRPRARVHPIPQDRHVKVAKSLRLLVVAVGQ